MAKIKPRFYAQALYDLSQEKGLKAQLAVERILHLMQKNKQLGFWPQVSRAYQLLLSQIEGKIFAKVYSAQPLAPEQEKKITLFLKKQTAAREVELETIIEPQIIGLKVETEQDLWDLSLTKQIKNFKGQLLKE